MCNNVYCYTLMDKSEGLELIKDMSRTRKNPSEDERRSDRFPYMVSQLLLWGRLHVFFISTLIIEFNCCLLQLTKSRIMVSTMWIALMEKVVGQGLCM